MKESGEIRLWEGVREDDFAQENNIEQVDIAKYDLEKWGIFSANVNYFRQLIRLSDSLKPVERRALITALWINALPGRVTKSVNLAGAVMKMHPHGTGAIYQSIVNMAQPWKRQCPLIQGSGNFGNDAYSNSYAQDRYTEVSLSRYAYECFFEDYDPDCVEMIYNTCISGPEPVSLPAKFPNVLVNGGVGMAPGNAFAIPPFNIEDIITTTKKLLRNPKATNIYMVPDFPCGCMVVDDGHSIKELCDNGKGTIRIRSRIEIVDAGKYWSLNIRSLPWLVSMETVHQKLIELAEKNVLPIKDIQERSDQVIGKNKNVRTRIDLRILIDKTQDPYAFRLKLYKMTKLEDTLACNFKVVTAEPKVRALNLRGLILSWIDERRSYKRRLYNKKLTKVNARLSLLDILIYLLEEDNITKTIKIIRNNNSDMTIKMLMEHGNMNSYQAAKIAEMPLRTFTKDARAKFIEERDKLEKEKKYLMKVITSEEAIDEIIMEEIDDLKKYGAPRKSEIVTLEDHAIVAKTDHYLVTTKQGFVKKLPYMKTQNPTGTVSMGVFRDLDYPTSRMVVNNMDHVLFFDSYGKFSNIEVNAIDNTELSNPGTRVFDFAKLNGEIVTVMPEFSVSQEQYIKDSINRKVYLVTLTKNGFIKKTQVSEYMNLKNYRNIRAVKVRSDDQLIYAGLMVDHVKFMIYTKNGYYTFLNLDQVSEQSKDSMGIIGIKLKDMDTCAGISVIGDKDKFITVVTAKGNVKKCEIEFFGDINKRGAASAYLTALDKGDSVIYADGMRKRSQLLVCTRNAYFTYDADQISTLTRKGKCSKLIPVPVGSNIISVEVYTPPKK